MPLNLKWSKKHAAHSEIYFELKLVTAVFVACSINDSATQYFSEQMVLTITDFLQLYLLCSY